MCEIIAFPNKKVISKEIEERLYGIAREYIDVLYEAMEAYVDDEDDFEGMETINKMVAKIYSDGLEVAIDDLDWDSD